MNHQLDKAGACTAVESPLTQVVLEAAMRTEKALSGTLGRLQGIEERLFGHNDPLAGSTGSTEKPSENQSAEISRSLSRVESIAWELDAIANRLAQRI